MFSHLLKLHTVTQLHAKLTFLKGIFRKNGYLENFIDECFKTFLNN